MKYKKLYGSIMTYNDSGKQVMKPIRAWIHFASNGVPPTIEYTFKDLPPIPEGCHRSLSITYRTMKEGLTRYPTPPKTGGAR